MKAKKLNNDLSNKKKARNIAISMHMALFIVALLPFSNVIKESDSEFNPIVEIVFSNSDISSGKASTAPTNENNDESKVDKKLVQTKAVPEIKKSAPILENTESPIKLDNNPEEIEVDEEIEETSIEEESNTNVEVSEANNESVLAKESHSDSDGEGDEGEHLDGKSLGDMDFDGEGVFGRKVIFHADVAGIAERNGKVVVNLCINRAGSVTHVAYNKNASTIKDSKYIKKALNVASDYLFESDFSAPSSQCGKLSFIFELK